MLESTIKITEKNIDIILNILYGTLINNEDQEKIKTVLFSNTMNSKGTIKAIASVLCKNYKCIQDNSTSSSINDLHIVDMGHPYQKTIVGYRDSYYWTSYGDIVENSMYCYV